MDGTNFRQLYITSAAGLGLGDLTRLKTGSPERIAMIDRCANGYCDATDNHNEVKRNQYISALIIMFWPEIGKMADKCKAVKELDFEDFITQLYKCIETACQYRAWKEGKHNAEQCIRSVIASRGAPAILYESNLDKNKANVNTCSLNANVSDDSETTVVDTVADDDALKFKDRLSAETLVQRIIDLGGDNVIDSVIFDNIAFGDSIRNTKETKTAISADDEKEYSFSTGYNEFSEIYLAKTLSTLPDTYRDYFLKKYDISADVLDAVLARIKSVDSTKIHKFIRAALLRQRHLLVA